MTHLILPKDIDSKFRFITVAAQRAKQIQALRSRHEIIVSACFVCGEMV